MTDEEVDAIWMALYRVEHYLLPYSSGEYMVYHHDTHRNNFSSEPQVHYEIICPRKFRIKLFYQDNKVKLSRETVLPNMLRNPNFFVEIPLEVKLEDYFEIKNWRGAQIPIALKRFETEYKVERLFNLFAFT